MLAHNSLREGAAQATKNIHTFPHLSNTGVKRRLARIRASEPDAGILVVTESLFSMDSDVPNLGELKAICRHYGATLMVDAAHDFGAIGSRGLGMLEIQNALDAPDILMGSFSKTFASNGGFVASNHPALKIALRFSAGPLTFTSALSPIQAAVVLKALEIVQSEEGAARRRRLLANATHLRNNLERHGFEVLGQPSAFLPITLGGRAMSRLAMRHMFSRGVIVNFVEYPAVARNSCRWRVQLMADHTRSQLDSFTDIAIESRAAALSQLGAPASEFDRGQIAAE
jgi:glycine C-acetyltransferase